MKKNIFRNKDYAAELVELIRRTGDRQRLPELLSDYHDKDIAEAVTRLSADERRELYRLLGTQRVSEIFSYLDDAEPYINELPVELAAKVVSGMDADDAVDVLDDLSGDKKQALVERLDSGARTDVQRILAYGEDEIGSCMTNNYICISEALTIRGAMSELVQQAGEHDNISTLYVVDAQGRFAGAIDLKDLIIAREGDRLEDIISRSYPYVFEHDRIDDCIERIRDYDEDSLPVLTQDGHIAGILTSSDIVELVDDAMGDDYAKLAGLTSEDDLKEPVTVSMKKRLPWLIALLFLGMAVSSVVGMFESVAAALPIVICFHGGQRRHSVAGCHHPRADVRGSDGAEKAVTAGEGDEDRLPERDEPRRDGAGVSRRVRARVQGLRMALGVFDLRLRGRVAGRGDGHLKPCRHGDTDVFPPHTY